jgi:hypothetical protein
MPVRIDILSGAGEGKSFYFDKRKLSIGSGARSDLRLDSLDATADGVLSAEIAIGPDGFTLSNSSSSELLVNGADVLPGGRRPVRSGDIVTLSARGPDLRFLLVPAIPDGLTATPSAVTTRDPPKANPPAKAPAATAMDWRLPVFGAAMVILVMVFAFVVVVLWPRPPCIA